MRLEDQVCTESQGIILKELKAPLNSAYFWRKGILYYPGMEVLFTKDEVPAYTVAELGILLPSLIQTDEDDYFYYSEKTINGEHVCGYCNPSTDNFLGRWQSENEATSKADCLIWLLENDKIKVEDLKL